MALCLRRFRPKRRGGVRRRLLMLYLHMFRFLTLTDELSVPVSYLLKGVGIFFGLVNTLHQRHDLPLAPSRARFSQSEAHMSHFVMDWRAQLFSRSWLPMCIIRLRHSFSASSLWCLDADPLYSS